MRRPLLENFTGVPAVHVWLARIYFTNLCLAILLLFFYLFNIRIPAFFNQSLPDVAMIALGYGLLFIIWMLLDITHLPEENLLASIYWGRGGRWYDAGIALGCLILTITAWQLNFLTMPLLAAAVLVFINGFLMASWLKPPYDVNRIQRPANQTPDPDAQQTPEETQQG